MLYYWKTWNKNIFRTLTRNPLIGGGAHMKNLFVLVLFLPFLFFMCVGFSTHVWEFPNRWFFSRLFWRCSWRLILHGRLWKDRYRYNILYQISKTQIQVQIQKVAPPVWKKTHLFGFLQTCVSFSTHLCIW